MLMSVQELKERLTDENLVVFDCRFQLSDVDWGDREYQAGHIPGAVYLNLDKDLSSPVQEHGGRHPLPNPELLAKKFGQAGVGRDSTVVVYDSGEGMATRAWWLLRYLGHNNVYVLNGGFKAWERAGYPVSTEIPVHKNAEFPLHIHSDWVVGFEEVTRIAKGDAPGQLVDARAPERFRGEVEPMDKKAGHIPTAVNAPWNQGVDEQGYWKSGEKQQERFRNIPRDKGPIVAYCGSGVTACGTLFGMALAGIEDAKLYAGSWSDWVSYDEAPIETGNERKQS